MASRCGSQGDGTGSGIFLLGGPEMLVAWSWPAKAGELEAHELR